MTVSLSLSFSSFPFHSLSCCHSLTFFLFYLLAATLTDMLEKTSLSLILCVRGRDDKSLSIQLSSWSFELFRVPPFPSHYFKEV